MGKRSIEEMAMEFMGVPKDCHIMWNHNPKYPILGKPIAGVFKWNSDYDAQLRAYKSIHDKTSSAKIVLWCLGVAAGLCAIVWGLSLIT